MNRNPITIIAIDGTSSSGKGTIAHRLSEHFGFHYLNSGALYRLVAYECIKEKVDLHDAVSVISISKTISPEFSGKKVLVEGEDVWPIISTQEYSNHASVISPIPEVRQALHQFQRDMIKSPGLVAEGRDMGTVVFTDAHIKLYLDADVKVRAERRHKDEEASGTGKTLEEITEELKMRDDRDKNRKESPLKLADDGIYIDTTNLNREEVLEKCILACKEKGIE